MTRKTTGLIVPATTSGAQLAAILNERDDAENTGHIAASGRPSYAKEGMIYATGGGVAPVKLWLAVGAAGPDTDLTVLFGVPPGTLRATAEVELATGWLWANGAAVPRGGVDGYPALFAAICPSFTGTVTNGTIATTKNFTALGGGGGLVGAKIEGPNVPATAVVTEVTASMISFSPAAVGTFPAGTYIIFPHGNTASTNFNLPNCKGRVVIGRGDMGGTDNQLITASGGAGFEGTRLGLAGSGGAQGVALALANIPPHSHTGSVSDNTSSPSSVVADSTPHTHALSSTKPTLRQIHTTVDQQGADNHSGHAHGPSSGAFQIDVADGTGKYTVGQGTRTSTSGATAAAGVHDHVLTLTGATDTQLPLSHSHALILSLKLTVDLAPLGPIVAHGNVQPSIVENVVIKY